jgi:hypothetical protein
MRHICCHIRAAKPPAGTYCNAHHDYSLGIPDLRLPPGICRSSEQTPIAQRTTILAYASVNQRYIQDEVQGQQIIKLHMVEITISLKY